MPSKWSKRHPLIRTLPEVRCRVRRLPPSAIDASPRMGLDRSSTKLPVDQCRNPFSKPVHRKLAAGFSIRKMMRGLRAFPSSARNETAAVARGQSRLVRSPRKTHTPLRPAPGTKKLGQPQPSSAYPTAEMRCAILGGLPPQPNAQPQLLCGASPNRTRTPISSSATDTRLSPLQSPRQFGCPGADVLNKQNPIANATIVRIGRGRAGRRDAGQGAASMADHLRHSRCQGAR